MARCWRTSTTAIAIYGADTRLKFFNTAFARLWRLDEAWLRTRARLRRGAGAAARAPPPARIRRFPRLQAQRLRLFTTLIEPLEELTYISRRHHPAHAASAPHPLGGLMFTYEDVTDTLVLERSYNTLIAVQRETLDNLLRRHRGVRRRRPAQAVQPGLCADLAAAGRKRSPASRTSPRSSRRRALLRLRRATGRAARPASSPASPTAAPRTGRLERAPTARCSTSPRCRCPTARPALLSSTSPTRSASSARCASATRRWRPPTGSSPSSSPTSRTSCARRSTRSSASPRSSRTSISAR